VIGLMQLHTDRDELLRIVSVGHRLCHTDWFLRSTEPAAPDPGFLIQHSCSCMHVLLP
jgi:hypothetical protein